MLLFCVMIGGYYTIDLGKQESNYLLNNPSIQQAACQTFIDQTPINSYVDISPDYLIASR